MLDETKKNELEQGSVRLENNIENELEQGIVSLGNNTENELEHGPVALEENTENTELSVESLTAHNLHFGKSFCSPKMKDYIFCKVNGIYIINMDHTLVLLQKALMFAHDVAEKGGSILWVPPSRTNEEEFTPQLEEYIRNIIQEAATFCQQPFMSKKWIPGFITNFSNHLLHLKNRISTEFRLNNDETLLKKEKNVGLRRINNRKELTKGVSNISKMPEVILSFGNPKAVKEVQAVDKNIKVIYIGDTDTHSNILGAVDFFIPANYSSILAVNYLSSFFKTAILQGKEKHDEKVKLRGNSDDRRYVFDKDQEKMMEKKYEGRYPQKRPFRRDQGFKNLNKSNANTANTA